MSFFKKIGKFAKKALPFAAAALPFVPGVGGALSGVLSKVGGFFGIGGGASQADPVVSSPGQGGVQQLPPMSVSPPTDWSKYAGAVGSLASAGLNYYGQQQANVANAQQAQQQMDFQERMSSSSYQRGTADMAKAGLNPMLAYSQGGASAPGGASAVMGNEAGAGANSALSALTTIQGLQNAQASADLTKAETVKTLAGVALTHAQTGQSESTARQADAATQNILAGLSGTEADSRVKQGTTDARVAQARADARIREAGVPAAEAEAKFYQSALGQESGFLGSAARAATVIKSIFGR